MSNNSKQQGGQNAKQSNIPDGFIAIRMLEGIAGPGFRAAPKQVILAKTDEAQRLIESGAACPVMESELQETASMPRLGEYRDRVQASQARMASA